MERYFVDSNVFLRFIVRDDTGQSAHAEHLFLRAKAGKIKLFCGPPVFFELADLGVATFNRVHFEKTGAVLYGFEK
jgi:predicted nucleic acid-binding protein